MHTGTVREGAAEWNEAAGVVSAASVMAPAPARGETSGNAASSKAGSATKRSSSALSGPKRPGCAASSFASSSPATSAIHAQRPADAISLGARGAEAEAAAGNNRYLETGVTG